MFILVAIAPYELAARKALDALLPKGHLESWRGYIETLTFFAGATTLPSLLTGRRGLVDWETWTVLHRTSDDLAEDALCICQLHSITTG